MDKKSEQFLFMTETPIPGLIIKLSIPTVISMLVTNIYNLVDTAFVGRLGNSASGAIGIVFGFMAIIQAIGFLFGQGSGSIISRSLGSQDSKKASIIASTGFFTAFFISIIVSILCWINLDSLVEFLGSTVTIAPFAKIYIKFILVTSPFMLTSFTLNNILRYEGKAFLGMIGLMAGAVLNILGDYIFMFYFHMGIAGAGLSTALSQIISFSILISNFILGRTQCNISIKYLKNGIKYILDILTTGLPSLLRQGLTSIATIILNIQSGFYGDSAVAAMSIVSRIFFMIFALAIGVCQGFQPVSGYNFGAGKFSRVKKAYSFSFFICELILVIFGSIVFFNSDNLVCIFRNDSAVIEIGSSALKYQCLSIVFLPFCMLTEMLLQSTGAKLSASILSSLRSGIIFIPILLIFTKFYGIFGIQIAQPVTNVLSFLPSIIILYLYFRKMPEDKEL